MSGDDGGDTPLSAAISRVSRPTTSVTSCLRLRFEQALASLVCCVQGSAVLHTCGSVIVVLAVVAYTNVFDKYCLPDRTRYERSALKSSDTSNLSQRPVMSG